MTRKRMHALWLLLSALLMVVLVVNCGGEKESTEMASPPPQDTAAPEPITITIGNITDLTGIASDGFITMNLSLKDTARYYTDHELIPGVKFIVVEYDTMYDPARYAAGYESLRDQGAEVFFTSIAEAGVALKPNLDEDRTVLFTVVPLRQSIEPPGRVFGVGCSDIASYAYTLLKWIAENDPDFPSDRPARIGGALWNEPYAQELLQAARAYAEAHPKQFDWVYGNLPDIKFTWDEEIEALKDCDYIIPPVLMGRFAADYAAAGYSARYLGTDAHLAFLGEIAEADLWDHLDGMLFMQSGIWWTDEGEIVDLTREILHEYHAGQEEAVKQMGTGYVTVFNYYVMFEHIAEAVEAVGAAPFSGQAVFDISSSFSVIANGSSHTYTETKRTSANDLAIYELRAAERDIFKTDPQWLSAVREPR